MVHESPFHTFKAYNDTKVGDLDKLNKKNNSIYVISLGGT